MLVSDQTRHSHGPARLRARWVISMELPPIENGEVVVENGSIIHVGKGASRAPSDAIDLGDCALMPGFVNVHAHLEYTVMRGLLEDIAFFPWIRTLNALKSFVSGDDWVASATLGAAEMLQAGVTTLADASDAGASLSALLSSGIRGIVFREVFGIEKEPATVQIVGLLDTKIKSMRAQIARAGGDERVTVGVSPHAPYTVRPDLLRALAEYAAREGLPQTIHVAESPAETELIQQGTGPFAEMFARRGIAWAAPGLSSVAYLQSCGVLLPGTLAVHVVHLAEGDAERLKATGATVAHCPKSNGKLGAGIAPIADLLAARVPVGLGTDSMASNNGADLFEEMRMAIYFARARAENPSALSAPAALRMATLGGAEVLGLERNIGSLKVGKQADICAVRLHGLHAFPAGEDNPVAALVYGCRASDVAMTMVNGRVLYENGRHVLLDVPRLRNVVGTTRKRLTTETEKLLGQTH